MARDIPRAPSAIDASPGSRSVNVYQIWKKVSPSFDRKRHYPSLTLHLFILPAVSTTSVNLTWNPTEQVLGDEVEFWSIQYKLELEADFKTHPDQASGHKDWQEVDGLRPGQRYLFRLGFFSRNC